MTDNNEPLLKVSSIIGLTLIISGAFFKISHWKGADLVFTAGIIAMLIYTIAFSRTTNYYKLYDPNINKSNLRRYIFQWIIFLFMGFFTFKHSHEKNDRIFIYVIFGLIAIDLMWTTFKIIWNHKKVKEGSNSDS